MKLVQGNLYPSFRKGSQKINNVGKRQLQESYLYGQCIRTGESEQYVRENNTSGNNG